MQQQQLLLYLFAKGVQNTPPLPSSHSCLVANNNILVPAKYYYEEPPHLISTCRVIKERISRVEDHSPAQLLDH